MAEKQKTIKKETRLSGAGIHSGKQVSIVLKPAPEWSGIQFSRSDLDVQDRVRAVIENVRNDHDRQTSVGNARWMIKTVEHLMAALHGIGVDNLIVEVSAEELPALDGSSRDYVEAIQNAGLIEQTAERETIQLTTPIYCQDQDTTLIVLPADELMITYILNYAHPDLSDQFFSSAIKPDVFTSQIAGARTFCLKEEAEALRKVGYGKGANLTNTLVFERNKPLENALRYDNEAARHKALDLLGDLYLVGQPVRAHIFACRTGHKQNHDLVKRLSDFRTMGYRNRHPMPEAKDFDGQCSQDVIKKILPHRYPFLFIDQILEIETGKRIVGLKKVQPDEFFFQGHFPGHPVMPGVLIIEALAQCGGFLMLSKPENKGKIAYFMTIDSAKFRQPVLPGEVLRLEAEVVRDRTRTGECHGRAYVGDKLVCEAEVRFAVVDNKS